MTLTESAWGRGVAPAPQGANKSPQIIWEGIIRGQRHTKNGRSSSLSYRDFPLDKGKLQTLPCNYTEPEPGGPHCAGLSSSSAAGQGWSSSRGTKLQNHSSVQSNPAMLSWALPQAMVAQRRKYSPARVNHQAQQVCTHTFPNWFSAPSVSTETSCHQSVTEGAGCTIILKTPLLPELLWCIPPAHLAGPVLLLQTRGCSGR